jgi:ABC-2 type transport system ATP-binding protein
MKTDIKNVTKKFRDRVVVDDLSFSLRSGQIVGLLGPNGAGKTTTLRMILDILKPDFGSILFENQEINREIRNRIGYLPEERGLYQKYSVMDVVIYFGRLKNLSRRKSHVETVRLLDSFQMIDYLEEPIGHLSKGLQQKLQFLVSLIHDPDILILDEPMWGLDPLNQEMISQRLRDLKKQGKSILLSTHQLADAESLCDTFVLINNGRLVLKGTLEQIRKNFYENMIVVETVGDPGVLKDIPNIKHIEINGNLAHLYTESGEASRAIMREIIKKTDIVRMETHKPSLHDIFMKSVKSEDK